MTELPLELRFALDFPLIPWSDIDPGIRALIYDLNLADYETSYSCQGDYCDTDPHGEGTAYISFNHGLAQFLIDELVELGLGVLISKDGIKTVISIYSHPTYRDSPAVEWSQYFVMENGNYREVSSTRVHSGLFWTDEERQTHNRSFQDKVRQVFWSRD
jgi:hypothetical protein